MPTPDETTQTSGHERGRAPAHRFEQNADGTWTHSHSQGAQNYRKAGSGTFYRVETPQEVVRILESAFALKEATGASPTVRVFYGDAATGRDWLEENDVKGRLGRSSGPLKVPLLLANSKSSGGSALLDHCIVRIQVEGKDRWRAANYHLGGLQSGPSPYPDAPFGVFRLGLASDTGGAVLDNIANFPSEARREGYLRFIRGESATARPAAPTPEPTAQRGR